MFNIFLTQILNNITIAKNSILGLVSFMAVVTALIFSSPIVTQPMVNLVIDLVSIYFIIYVFFELKILKNFSNKTIATFALFTMLCIMASLVLLGNMENFIESTVSLLNSFIFFDGVSLWLVWLAALVTLILFIGVNPDDSNFTNKFYNTKIKLSYTATLLAIILFSIVCFLVKNLFIFFIFFEMILLPLVFHILTQGSRVNSIQAVKYLVMFTLVGSIFLWIPLVYFIEVLGTSDFDILRWIIAENVNSGTRKLLFLSLFIGFSFKVPLVPLHQWLIIAHVEAPTTGSIVLAALLLKVGGYGLYRFTYNLFPIESYIFSNEIIALAIFGYSYATLLAIKQVDVKRFIAYTSISHMNFSLIGLFSGFEVGFGGFIHTMISHGIIATAMFYLIGYLYANLSYRDTLRVSGLVEVLPVFSAFWFLFSVANMGMPLFSAFPGELFVLISLASVNPAYVVFTFFGFFFTGVYTFLQLNKLIFSNFRGYSSAMFSGKVTDLSTESISALSILLVWTLILGVCPDIVLKNLEI